MQCFGKYDFRFLIKWRGWSEDENTWEPFHNVRGCHFNLKEFYNRCYSNKKQNNTDCWRMFLGCLERENLLDEKGQFKAINIRSKKRVTEHESD